MKRILIVCFALLLFVGCANKNPSTTPLPTGAISQQDASTYRVLADAHAFLQSIHDSVTAGTLTLSATQKKVFNDLATASNSADALWKQYHAGNTSVLPQLTAATNNLNAALGTAQAQIGSGQ